jgi:hypothetical protein
MEKPSPGRGSCRASVSLRRSSILRNYTCMRPSAIQLCFALLSFTNSAFAANLQVSAPQSSTIVMIDGKLSPDEWKDAARIEVPEVGDLYFKQAGGFVYVAVKYRRAPSGIVDLYLSPGDGHIYDLHASAKLGERELQQGKWPDWTWWNNRDWVANVSRVDSWDKRTFLPEPIREYQILRSRFPARKWRLRFELTAITPPNESSSTSVFPPGTSDHDPAGWLELDLK